ncbi:MAG: symmetrical bis(5'-nucleosyl)-tetraphosphatase [Gammaproteobacteria bacterium]
MPTYAVGDIQGCRAELEDLLAALRFDPARDRLWLTGDLVNRGPDSLGVMRLVMALDACVVTVLGNHDLHLVALARSANARLKRKDTVDDILEAPERDAIVDWLRRRPLLHHDPALGAAMVHAGVPPAWDLPLARALAGEVEGVLRDDDALPAFLAAMYGDEPRHWDPALTGMARLRFVTNCFTRMRYLAADGGLELGEKRGPAQAAAELLPWFMHPARRTRGTRIAFGHWSTLELADAEQDLHNVFALDTGAVWGGRLTAVCLEDGTRHSVAARTAVPLD